MDSIPLILITGQVPRAMIGKGAFQETDVFGLALPIVKHSYLVMNVEDIPRVIKEAFYIANTGRPGPVWIDIPKDVQQSNCKPVFPDKINLRGYTPTSASSDIAVNEIAGLIEKSERPVIYAGGGIISSNAARSWSSSPKRAAFPLRQRSWASVQFPLSIRFRCAGSVCTAPSMPNYAVDKSDLLLALGVRFDDRVTGKVSEFAKHGTIVHIDVDPSEINKNKVAHLPSSATSSTRCNSSIKS